MLFSGKSHEELIERNARCMMKHLSISIDDDFQRTLSFFEKVGHSGFHVYCSFLPLFPSLFIINSSKLPLCCSWRQNMEGWTYWDTNIQLGGGNQPSGRRRDRWTTFGL